MADYGLAELMNARRLARCVNVRARRSPSSTFHTPPDIRAKAGDVRGPKPQVEARVAHRADLPFHLPLPLRASDDRTPDGLNERSVVGQFEIMPETARAGFLTG